MIVLLEINLLMNSIQNRRMELPLCLMFVKRNVEIEGISIRTVVTTETGTIGMDVIDNAMLNLVGFVLAETEINLQDALRYVAMDST